MARASVSRTPLNSRRAIKQRWLLHWLASSLSLLPVSVLFEFPRVNVVIPRPDTSSVSLCVVERLKISLVGFVSIKNPSPAVEDHFKFDVPAKGLFRV